MGDQWKQETINEADDGKVQHGRFRRPLLVVAVACALALAALTTLVYLNPVMGWDAALARSIQGVDVGPLGGLFSLYQQIGGPYAVVVEGIVFAVVLVLNWRAWRLLIAGTAASAWYFGIVSLILRPRPSVPDVLRVTEHPGHSSYPSGHMVLFVFYAVILMTTLGMKYLPRWAQFLGWALAVTFVLLGGFSRIYSGAHWPTDVLAGALIGVGWFSLVLAVRWISDPVFRRHKNKVTDSTKTN
jgi:undecaprenyl-diphosphatase